LAERFYCADLPTEGIATLVGDEAHHLSRVRRVQPGEIVELFNGQGMGRRAVVGKLHKDRVELTLREPIDDRTPPIELTLATAVPKGERFDWLVEKATELGVSRLVPIRWERSTVDPRRTKLDRLRRTVIEAAKQCGRNRLMELVDPTDWSAYVDVEGAAIRILADPSGTAFPATWNHAGRAGVALAVGPEGGLTPAEVERAGAAGWHSQRLSNTVLRIETAALAGCALLLGLAEKGAE
jgi:16S rRNA (uracil1498-N3)-methyltransferase